MLRVKLEGVELLSPQTQTKVLASHLQLQVPAIRSKAARLTIPLLYGEQLSRQAFAYRECKVRPPFDRALL